jgi:hypothetical protein
MSNFRGGSSNAGSFLFDICRCNSLNGIAPFGPLIQPPQLKEWRPTVKSAAPRIEQLAFDRSAAQVTAAEGELCSGYP